MQAVTFIFAFMAVLALIGVVAWLIRRFASNRLGANTQRGRMPRLAVIDAAAVDGRRRLVLVRRDNVEHLLMIGGPTDIVVEPNIVRSMPGREQLPARPAVASADTPLPRVAPLPDVAGWNDVDAPARAGRAVRTCRAANARAAAASPRGRPLPRKCAASPAWSATILWPDSLPKPSAAVPNREANPQLFLPACREANRSCPAPRGRLKRRSRRPRFARCARSRRPRRRQLPPSPRRRTGDVVG